MGDLTIEHRWIKATAATAHSVANMAGPVTVAMAGGHRKRWGSSCGAQQRGNPPPLPNVKP